MSKFDEIFGEVKKPGLQGVEMYGVFDCQFCQEDVELATYYPTESLLTWTCSLGHKSFMEKFNVGG